MKQQPSTPWRMPPAKTHFLNSANATHDGRQESVSILTKASLGDSKRAEDASGNNSEEQYRLLFETNPIPMWVFDLNTLRFLTVNQAAIRQYGFTEWEFLAMTIRDIRPEQDIPNHLDDVAKRKQGLQEPGVWRHRKQNGVIIDVEIVCHSLDLHGAEAMLVLTPVLRASSHERRSAVPHAECTGGLVLQFGEG